MLTARQALETATLGGARVLGRDDVGSLQPGMACDLAAFRVDTPAMSGAADPVAALMLCGPVDAAELIVHGRRVVSGGRLTGLEIEPLIERHRALARSLVGSQG